MKIKITREQILIALGVTVNGADRAIVHLPEIIEVDVDLQDYCPHLWFSIGATSISDPPVFHSACPLCMTFKHTAYYDERDGEALKDKIKRQWFTKEWGQGPWSWEQFRKGIGV